MDICELAGKLSICVDCKRICVCNQNEYCEGIHQSKKRIRCSSRVGNFKRDLPKYVVGHVYILKLEDGSTVRGEYLGCCGSALHEFLLKRSILLKSSEIKGVMEYGS